MLRELIEIAVNHPLLGLVFILDLSLILLIVSYIGMRIAREKKPIRKIAFLLKKMSIKLHSGEIKSIEDLYRSVIDAYAKKGIVDYEDGYGFRAREKILDALEGREREVVEKIFELYEAKLYGGEIGNEEEAVASLLSAFRSI